MNKDSKNTNEQETSKDDKEYYVDIDGKSVKVDVENDEEYSCILNPSLISQNYFRLFLGVLAELTCWYSSTASCKVEL